MIGDSSTTLKAVLVGEDRSMSRTFDGAGRKAEATGGKISGLGGSIKGLLGPIGLAIGAIGLGSAAFDKLGQFVGDSIAEARESQKVNATTAQIIKSTGGAAKVSADHIGDLTTSISNKVGMDDEAIQSGANLLLTFKRVRNEVGEGSNVFDRATQAAVDLSAAGFGDVNSASKMLGKALNDPLKGLTALGRAGVTFTTDQQKQIKKLVETGDLLGAQKIILGEVESQVGGVAAASSTMSEKATVAWDNFKEKVGTKLLPVLDKIAGWFIDKGLPALERFGGWVTGSLWPALKKGYDEILPALKDAWETVSGAVGDSGIDWEAIGKIITENVIPFISKLVKVWLPQLAAQWAVIIGAIKAVWKVFETWRNIVATVLGFVIGKIAELMRTFADMLRAMSKVPGFGWAKDAADKLDKAAGKASTLSRNLSNIPRNVNVSVNVSTRQLGGRITLPNGQRVNVGMRAGGGPLVKGAPYLVGENGPELIYPDGSGRVMPARQTARILRGGTGGGADAGAEGGGLQPMLVQLILEGRVIHEVLVRLKRQRGGELGLA